MPRARVAVVGVGHTPVSRHAETPPPRLVLEACTAAVSDAGLQPADIDGVVTVVNQPSGGPGIRDGVGTRDGPDVVRPTVLGRALGLDVAWMESVDTTVMEAFITAAHAVAAGTCRAVLVYRVLHNPIGRYGASATREATGPTQFTSPYGIEPPSLYATFAQRYFELYGVGRHELGALAVQSRANGLRCNYGYWARTKPELLTLDQYMAARMVSTPLCLYDCDIPVDGCGAFVLAAADAAANMTDNPAYILGMAGREFRSRTVVSTLEEASAYAKSVAKRIWANAGIAPSDIRTANIYDGFTIITPLWLEALGFFPIGESLTAIADGHTAPGGALPLNTSGGNQGIGRMHGVPHLMESVLQVTGRAGERQIEGVDLTLTVVGGLGYTSHCGGVVFSSSPVL